MSTEHVRELNLYPFLTPGTHMLRYKHKAKEEKQINSKKMVLNVGEDEPPKK